MPIEHKSIIKTILKREFNNVYNISEFNNILENIHKHSKLSDMNINLIYKIVSKYISFRDNKFIINTKEPSYYTYNTVIQKVFLSDIKYIPIKKQVFPSTKHWVHDEQVDDDITDKSVQRRIEVFRKISSVEYPAQRSPQWYLQRDQKITASDIGLCLGDDHHNMVYSFLVKKFRSVFTDNPATYHGKKLEAIATMIYEYRMNLHVEEFGLCHHPKYSFLGASPDGIVSEYKYNQQNKTNYVGRMLEIKCPISRRIKITGNIKGDICPTYYWDQVQIQLECCDLDECDFWQCDIKEYDTKEDFILDTDLNQPFKSKKTGNEKGCLIQLLPKDKFVLHEPNINDDEYNKCVYSNAQFLYPPKVNMTPYECDVWITETLKNLDTIKPNYQLDKIKYWYLNFSFCQTIKRDREWFANSINDLSKMWERVIFIRNNSRCKEIFLNYHDNYLPECNADKNPEHWKDKYHHVKENKNKFMLEMVDKMMDLNNNQDKLNRYLNTLEHNIKS